MHRSRSTTLGAILVSIGACATEPSSTTVQLESVLADANMRVADLRIETLLLATEAVKQSLRDVGATANDQVPNPLRGQVMRLDPATGDYLPTGVTSEVAAGAVSFEIYRVIPGERAHGAILVMPLDPVARAMIAPGDSGGVSLRIEWLDGSWTSEFEAALADANEKVAVGTIAASGDADFSLRILPVPGLIRRLEMSVGNVAAGYRIEARFDLPPIAETVDSEIFVDGAGQTIRFQGRSDVHTWSFTVSENGSARYHIGADRQINPTFRALQGQLRAEDVRLLEELLKLNFLLQAFGSTIDNAVQWWPRN